MEKQISVYKGTINYIHDMRGEDFSLDQPHKNIWNRLINFLRKRGYKVGVNPYYKEHYKMLSKYHKIGERGGIIILLEIRASGIEVKVGHTKNFWHNMGTSFWDDWHDKYTRLSYLENKAVELEINRVIEFFSKQTQNIKIRDKKQTPLEQIFEKEAVNTHIHGGAQSIEEIKEYMKTKNTTPSNVLDKNEKEIITGQRKYFYDRKTKRMFSGIAVHNINNMWWMVMNNTLANIANFELFDYSEELPKRKPADKEQIEKVLDKFVKQKDFLKAHKFCQFHRIKA